MNLKILLLLLIITLSFFGCNESNPISSKNVSTLPPNKITVQTDSSKNIVISWEDISVGEKGYFIEKVNHNTQKLDSFYLPENSTLFNDNDVKQNYEYNYSVGTITQNDSIIYAKSIKLKYEISWSEYFNFLAPMEWRGFSLSFSMDEKYIVCGSGGNVYSLETKSFLKKIAPIGGLPCDFGNDNSILFGENLYDFSTGSSIEHYDMPYEIFNGKISGNGDFVGLYSASLWSSSGGFIKIFNIDGTKLFDIEGFSFFNFNSTSKKFLYAAWGDSLSLVDLTSGKMVQGIRINKYFISDAVFSSDDNYIAIATQSEVIHIWDVPANKWEELYTGNNNPYYYIQCVEFLPYGHYLLSNPNGVISIWDIELRKKIKDITPYLGDIRDIEISSSGNYLAAYIKIGEGGDLSTVKVFENKGNWNIIE